MEEDVTVGAEHSPTLGTLVASLLLEPSVVTNHSNFSTNLTIEKGLLE